MKSGGNNNEDFVAINVGCENKSFWHVREVLKGLHFVTTTTGAAANGWSAVSDRFDELTVHADGLLPSHLFGDCIGMNQESRGFSSELFRALARRHNVEGDSINKVQFQQFWDQLLDESFDSRLQNFFDLVDRDADGIITQDDIKQIISLSASANKLSNIQKHAQEYAALIMEGLDPNNVGHIMIDNLRKLLVKPPTQSVRAGDGQILKELLGQQCKTSSNPIKSWYRKMKYALADNWQRIWILTLWLGAMVGLFIYKFVQYQDKSVYYISGNCICVAKGAAETLKFNMALILLPVCRNTVTWLRNKTKLGLVLPFNDYLSFHKVIAVGIGIGITLHGGAHLTCHFWRILHATKEQYKTMEPFFGEEQPSSYLWFLKGIEVVTGVIMVVLMSIASTLATSRPRHSKINLPRSLRRFIGYNTFWYSHHLFIIVYAILIVHGFYLYLVKKWYHKNTWAYTAVPVILYASERLIRALRSSFKRVMIREVSFLPGNVMSLQLSRPQGFHYKSGQYMLINCHPFSHLEWHAFSFSSSPADDYLSISIRTLGDWTKQLGSIFLKV